MSYPFYPQFPLVNRALSEQATLFSFWTGEMPDEEREMQTLGLQMIDATISLSPEDKEALMVGLVLYMSPAAMFDDPDRFAKTYNEDVQAVVYEILGQQPGQPLSQTVAQIKTAQQAAYMDISARVFNGMKGQIPPDIAQEALDNIAADVPGEEKMMFPNLNNAGLRRTYDDAKNLLTGVLVELAYPGGFDTPPRNPPGPSF